MPMFGANPEELDSLGNSMKHQEETINGVISAVNSALSGTTWEGPARAQFENDWNTTFKSALNQLNTAFESAGSDCLSRSNDLRQVMGSSR